VAPCHVRRSLSVLFSVLSVPLWFLFLQMTRVCAREHGEKTVNGFAAGPRTRSPPAGLPVTFPPARP